MVAQDLAVEVVNQVAKVQSKYWKSINPRACEPPEVGSGDGALVVPIPELLKTYRGRHMRHKHGLVPVPIASEELEAMYGGQIYCNTEVYDQRPDSVHVLFVHDFGNLRVERNSTETTDVHLTNSYLLDTSDVVVNWVLANGWNLIDVNILRQLPTTFPSEGPRMVSNRGDKHDGELLRYLWENFIEWVESC